MQDWHTYTEQHSSSCMLSCVPAACMPSAHSSNADLYWVVIVMQ